MTVKRLRREMETAEFTGWAALYELESDERKRQEARSRAGGGRRGRRR